VIDKLPPSLAALLGALVFGTLGLMVGSASTYMYTKESIKAETAEAERDRILHGEEAAKLIRNTNAVSVLKSQKLVAKVKNGEKKILSKSGNSISSDFTRRLQRKISEARAFSD